MDPSVDEGLIAQAKFCARRFNSKLGEASMKSEIILGMKSFQTPSHSRFQPRTLSIRIVKNS